MKKHEKDPKSGIKEKQETDLNLQEKDESEDAGKPVVKYPIKFRFDSPRPLSPSDKTRSKIFGGKCC